MNISIQNNQFTGAFQGKDANTGRAITVSIQGQPGTFNIEIFDTATTNCARNNNITRDKSGSKSSVIRGTTKKMGVDCVEFAATETSLLGSDEDNSNPSCSCFDEDIEAYAYPAVDKLQLESDNDSSSDGYEGAQGLSQESFGFRARNNARTTRRR